MALRHRKPAPEPAIELLTSAPAFATNERLEIVSWNDAARRLLGFDASEVLGKSCAEVTGCASGGDPARCLHGQCGCGPADRAEEGLPLHDRFVRRKDGRPVSATICTVLVRAPGSAPLLLHLLRDGAREAQLEDALRDIAALAARSRARRDGGEGEAEPLAAAPPELLTQREHEVLRLLHGGADTAAIASALFVSPATVRNHIQSVFRKLHAHSRLEAVSRAVKTGIL